MWWLFEKLSESAKEILYAYSTGNRNLDGRISINPETQEIRLLKPCAEDQDSKFAQNVAMEKAWWIMDLGFPQHEQVACG